MQKRRAIRGQSTAEYAVLFAIVIGAAIAMQQYVAGHLKGAIADATNKYSTAAGGTGTFEDPNRTSTSHSDSNLNMTSAKAGAVNIDSRSNSTQNK